MEETKTDGFVGVIGVPEGWELVRIGPLFPNGLPCCYLGENGEVEHYDGSGYYKGMRVIIRKIETPKQYCAFNDYKEYLPHWGKPIAKLNGTGVDSIVSTSSFGVYVAIASDVRFLLFADAFNHYTFADGTPFGVEVE